MDGTMPDVKSLPIWLEWAREIQALAQTGLAFSQNPYEKERNEKLMRLASEMIAGHSNLDENSIHENMLKQSGYATPKIDVRGAIIRNNKILLVQEAMDGKWCMPGGWADVGDEPAASVIREVREESGFDVRLSKIIGVFDANRDGRPLELYHAFKIVFLGEITGGQAKTSHETLAVDFFPLDDPPPLSMNRTHSRHLEEIRNHLENPERPTYFE
jgi:ADP-ribose pyrophosphatase YjhB (NUDIX family)